MKKLTISKNAMLFYDPQGKERVESDHSVVVIGGGIAGLSAATVLAERGVEVTLIEREGYLGGRAGAWQDALGDGTEFQMERGFHAFFRQYYNLRNLMRRVDPDLKKLMPLTDYPLVGPDGLRESFSNLPKKAPWNLAKLVWRSSSIGMLDLFKINGPVAQAMLAYDRETTYEQYDAMTAREYLDSLRFPPQARRMLFDVFAHSFFNPEHDFSAAELLMMFHYYFLGNPEGLIFDVLTEPFGRALWKPMGEYLEQLGVRIEYGTSVERVERVENAEFKGHERWRVQTDRGHFDADALVMAVTVPALKSIAARSPDLEPANIDIESLDVTWPFVVWRIWLDKPITTSAYPFVGTSGLGVIDNISLYHLFEDESAAWAEKHNGAVVELHAYCVEPEAHEAAIRADLLAQLYEVYPETKDATIVEERYILRRDCPAFKTDSDGSRPEVHTDISSVTLAGDFVKLPFPTALMERAASSGMLAANELLKPLGVKGEAIYSIPMTGLLARTKKSA